MVEGTPAGLSALSEPRTFPTTDHQSELCPSDLEEEAFPADFLNYPGVDGHEELEITVEELRGCPYQQRLLECDTWDAVKAHLEAWGCDRGVLFKASLIQKMKGGGDSQPRHRRLQTVGSVSGNHQARESPQPKSS